MPYDGFGNWVDSKTDLTTDTLGFGEIGGVGQLVYRLFRFKKYVVRYNMIITAINNLKCSDSIIFSKNAMNNFILNDFVMKLPF